MLSSIKHYNTAYGGRVLHTINQKNTNRVSIINVKDSEDFTKSTVVTFQRKEDAHKMAYIMEYHRNTKYTWTNTEILLGDNKTSVLFPTDYDPYKELEELSIQNWDFMHLKNYSIQNNLNVLIIDEFFKDDNENKMRIIGKLVTSPENPLFYVNALNNIFKE